MDESRKLSSEEEVITTGKGGAETAADGHISDKLSRMAESISRASQEAEQAREEAERERSIAEEESRRAEEGG